MLPSSLGNLRTRTGLFTDRRHTHRHTQHILSQHLLHVRWRDEWKGRRMFCRETRRYQPLSVRVSIWCWLLSEEELHSEAHRSTRSSESIWGKQQYRTGTETAVALVSMVSIRLWLFNIYKYGCSGRKKNPSGPKVSFVIKLVCENLTFDKYK